MGHFGIYFRTDKILPGGAEYQPPSYSHPLGSLNRPQLVGKFTTSGPTMWGIIDSGPGYAPLGYHHDGDILTNVGYPNNGIAVAGEWYQMDLRGQGYDAFKLDEIKFHYGGTGNGGTWKVQMYNGAWVDISNQYIMYDSNPQTIIAQGEGFTMLRILGVNGNSLWIEWREIELKIGGLVKYQR